MDLRSSPSRKHAVDVDVNATMTRRRTIHNYPEHLNPFHEQYAETSTTENGKYGTWSSNSRSRIRNSVLESTWIEALNLTPAKKKVTKKWSLFKSRTVEKFQRARSKSDAFEHRIQRSDKLDLDINARRALFANRIATSTPVKTPSPVLPTPPTSPIHEQNAFEVVKPKIRKKRSAPLPPSFILNPDSDTSLDLGSWISPGSTEEVSILQISDNANEESNSTSIDEIQISHHTNNSDYQNQSSGKKSPEIRPLIEQPNIATLISNNLTL